MEKASKSYVYNKTTKLRYLLTKHISSNRMIKRHRTLQRATSHMLCK